MQRVTRVFPSTPVRNTRPSATIGEECPGGSATFHRTLRSVPSSAGRFADSRTPDPPGPRNRDHSSPPAGWACTTNSSAAAVPIRIMVDLRSFSGA
jgi:hypothetical protein